MCMCRCLLSQFWIDTLFTFIVYGGKVTEKILFQDNAIVGKSYSISGVRFHDGGIYECHTVNTFGEVKQNVTLTVSKYFG